MGNGDPVPSVSEQEASAEIAALYADIRTTLGVPLVNLIWRNLATMPGALEWAWNSVKPLYASSRIQNEAAGLVAAQRLPHVPGWPVAALRAVGIESGDDRVIRAVLDSYDRSNPLNLIALNVLLAVLRNEDGGTTESASVVSKMNPFDVSLPRLVNLDEIPQGVAELVRAVNRLGARGREHIIVSMPRHLAHWPGFLALYWSTIAPLDASGELGRCIDTVLEDGRSRGALLASAADRSLQLPEESREGVEATLDDFCRNAISRMIPVVSLLRKALPAPTP